jgi:hypothetical protein
MLSSPTARKDNSPLNMSVPREIVLSAVKKAILVSRRLGSRKKDAQSLS